MMFVTMLTWCVVRFAVVLLLCRSDGSLGVCWQLLLSLLLAH